MRKQCRRKRDKSRRNELRDGKRADETKSEQYTGLLLREFQSLESFRKSYFLHSFLEVQPKVSTRRSFSVTRLCDKCRSNRTRGKRTTGRATIGFFDQTHTDDSPVPSVVIEADQSVARCLTPSRIQLAARSALSSHWVIAGEAQVLFWLHNHVRAGQTL